MSYYHHDTVRMTTLSNGLRVASDTMAHVKSVSLGIWVNAGARYEKIDHNGVAHLLEHMLFKGTPSRSAREIAETIENVGGQMNAYTARENTAYYSKMLAEDAGLGLGVLADMLQNSLFDADELARERQVVLQEIGQSFDTPDDIIFDYFQETAFPNQALGRPVLGLGDVVGEMSRDTLCSYLNTHYSPDRVIICAAGAIDHETLVEMASNLFTRLPAPAQIICETGQYHGGDFRKEDDLEQLHFLLGLPSLSVYDSDYYALNVASSLLGGGMSSRLFQEIREKRGLVYSIYSFNHSYRDSGLFGVYAGTGPERIGELVPVLCDALQQASCSIQDDAELSRAKATMRAGLLMAQESTSARCEQLAQQILVHAAPRPLETQLEKLERVDAAACQRVMQRLLQGKPTIAALGNLGGLETYDAIAARLAA